MTAPGEELLTVPEAARELELSELYVSKLVATGVLTSVLVDDTAHGPARRRRLIARAELERFRSTPRQRGSRRRIGDVELRTAIAGLRAGLTEEAAAERAGMTGRALRQRLTALGLRAGELQPEPLPAAIDLAELRARRNLHTRQRHWDASHRQQPERYTWNPQSDERRRDLHIMLTEAAWEAVHEEAERRRCSMSALVTAALYDAGIIPEV